MKEVSIEIILKITTQYDKEKIKDMNGHNQSRRQG